MNCWAVGAGGSGAVSLTEARPTRNAIIATAIKVPQPVSLELATLPSFLTRQQRADNRLDQTPQIQRSRDDNDGPDNANLKARYLVLSKTRVGPVFHRDFRLILQIVPSREVSFRIAVMSLEALFGMATSISAA
jgi:hypothetical protein